MIFVKFFILTIFSTIGDRYLVLSVNEYTWITRAYLKYLAQNGYEASPLPVPLDFARGQGGPQASRQSLRKDFITILP
jgi:hypothetical protein